MLWWIWESRFCYCKCLMDWEMHKGIVTNDQTQQSLSIYGHCVVYLWFGWSYPLLVAHLTFISCQCNHWFCLHMIKLMSNILFSFWLVQVQHLTLYQKKKSATSDMMVIHFLFDVLLSFLQIFKQLKSSYLLITLVWKQTTFG